MSSNERKRAYRRDLSLASLLLTTGLVMTGLSLVELHARGPGQMAQATQPLQASPPQASPSDAQNKPAESKPGGERPTTPAPEPARPDEQPQKAGAQPVLPPAPAEKVAPPIKDK
jgi:hypothetical protein